MSETSDPRLYHAHVARNREPIQLPPECREVAVEK